MMRRNFILLTALVLIAACGGGDGGTTQPNTNPAITLTAASTAGTVARGASSTTTLTLSRVDGFAGTVNLTAEGVPAGVTAQFAPASLTGATVTSTATFTVGATATPGASTITIRAAGTGVTDKTLQYALTIPAPGMTLTAGVNTLAVVQGAAGTVPVTIARTNGAAGAVTLTADGVPAGVTAVFNPATIAEGQTTSTLTLTAAAGAAVATNTVTIRAALAGVADQSAGVQLSVTAAATPAYTLTATPAAVTVTAGQTATSAIVIAKSGGFAGSVTLSVAGAPAGVTATFAPNPATGTTSTLSLVTTTGAAAGTYALTLRGTATGLTDRTIPLSLTISAPAGGTNFAWQFCDATRVPLWFAYRDGTAGTWTRVTAGGANTFNFTLTQSVGAVAYVTNDGGETNTEVFYGTRAELQRSLEQECAGNPTAGKSLSGTVAGLSALETASVFHGGAQASASFAAPAYQLQNVATGNQELFAMRTVTNFGPPPTTSVNRMFLQRNVNVASGGNLPVVDFAGASSFAPATANVTVANAGADQIFMSNMIRFASGTEATFPPDLLATGTTRPFYGVPTAMLAQGDLHAALVVAAGTSDQRLLYTYFRTVSDRTVTLGPTLATVTVSSTTAGGLARPKASANIQTEYGDAFGVTFSQNNGNRVVTISASRGYFAGTQFELETPNFAGVDGFNAVWGLQAGVTTEAQVSAIGGIAGVINQPADGTSWRVAARSSTFTP